MPQVTDWSTDNAGGAAFRAQLNGILAAIQGSSSGVAAPSPTVAGMFWLDTGVSPAVLRVRNAANTAWIAASPETLAANSLWGNPTGAAAAMAAVSMAQLKTMLGFTLSAADPGYIILPTGLIVQWGTSGTISAGGGVTVTLPVAFPTNHWRTIVSPITSASNTSVFSVGARALTLTNFIANNNSGTSGAVAAAYISIGN